MPSGWASRQEYCAYPFITALLVLTRCPIILHYHRSIGRLHCWVGRHRLVYPSCGSAPSGTMVVGWRLRTLSPSGRLPHPTGVPLFQRGGDPPPSRVFFTIILDFSPLSICLAHYSVSQPCRFHALLFSHLFRFVSPVSVSDFGFAFRLRSSSTWVPLSLSCWCVFDVFSQCQSVSSA